MKTKIVCIVLLGVAFVYMKDNTQPPTPTPDEPAELDLSGAFQGPTAAEDAATVAALSSELADIMEYDQGLPNPMLKTGIALDSLRVRARTLRCRGRCLSDTHPQVAKLVGNYLDEKVGNAGGPVTPSQVAKWVKAYKEISKAASRAID